MNKLIFPLFFVFLSYHINAQVLYPTQPKTGYYETIKSIIIPLVPTESQLINAKASDIPANFKDTLLKYDWYEIASYYIFDKAYRTEFGKDLAEREEKYANNEFAFFRYTPEGISYDMKLDRKKDGTIKITTTTFNEKTATKLVEVKKEGTKNMMITNSYGTNEKQEIISYSKGLMIRKLRQSPNTTTKIFIIAYMAIPKTF